MFLRCLIVILRQWDSVILYCAVCVSTMCFWKYFAPVYQHVPTVCFYISVCLYATSPKCIVSLQCILMSHVVAAKQYAPCNESPLNSISEMCPRTVSLECVANTGVCISADILLCDFRAGGASSYWAEPHSVIKILFSLTTPFHGSFFTCAKNTQSALAKTRGEGGGEHSPLSERTCKCGDGQELGTYDLT